MIVHKIVSFKKTEKKIKKTVIECIQMEIFVLECTLIILSLKLIAIPLNIR